MFIAQILKILSRVFCHNFVSFLRVRYERLKYFNNLNDINITINNIICDNYMIY